MNIVVSWGCCVAMQWPPAAGGAAAGGAAAAADERMAATMRQVWLCRRAQRAGAVSCWLAGVGQMQLVSKSAAQACAAVRRAVSCRWQALSWRLQGP